MFLIVLIVPSKHQTLHELSYVRIHCHIYITITVMLLVLSLPLYVLAFAKIVHH